MDNKPQPTIQINGGTNNQIIIQTEKKSTVCANNNVTNSNNDNATLKRIEKSIDEIKIIQKK